MCAGREREKREKRERDGDTSEICVTSRGEQRQAIRLVPICLPLEVSMVADGTNGIGYAVTSYDGPYVTLFDWFPFIYEQCCQGNALLRRAM